MVATNPPSNNQPETHRDDRPGILESIDPKVKSMALPSGYCIECGGKSTAEHDFLANAGLPLTNHCCTGPAQSGQATKF
jgi:hypothetical protein